MPCDSTEIIKTKQKIHADYEIRGCADWQQYSRLCHSNQAQFVLRHFHQPDPLTQCRMDLWIYVVKLDMLFCCYSPFSSRLNVLCIQTFSPAQHCCNVWLFQFLHLPDSLNQSAHSPPTSLTDKDFHPLNWPLTGCFLFFTPLSRNSRDCCV